MLKESIILFAVLALTIMPAFAAMEEGKPAPEGMDDSDLAFWTSTMHDMDNDDKVEFGLTLEETLGHFWALEVNLDDENSDLALVHATHPIAELYETMNEYLQVNATFNAHLKQTLLELQNKANTNMTRADSQMAIDEAKGIIEEARAMILADKSNDAEFKMQLMAGLLQTAKVEYAEAVQDGAITEMAEFQDGSSFVWRSQEIYKTVKADLDPIDSSRLDDYFAKVVTSMNANADPLVVENWIDAVIYEIEELSGIVTLPSAHEAMEDAMEDAMEEEHEMDAHDDEMEEMMDDEMEKEMMVAELPPLKQLAMGVEAESVTCADTLQLVFSPNGDPACVKQTSVVKLATRGWTS